VASFGPWAQKSNYQSATDVVVTPSSGRNGKEMTLGGTTPFNPETAPHQAGTVSARNISDIKAVLEPIWLSDQQLK
jgi:hypothetical protein